MFYICHQHTHKLNKYNISVEKGFIVRDIHAELAHQTVYDLGQDISLCPIHGSCVCV